MKIKTNRKYRALLFLLIMMPLFFFCCYIFAKLIFSLFIYILYGDFIFNINDLYIACKLTILGLPVGIVFWLAECRRLGIKILGK